MYRLIYRFYRVWSGTRYRLGRRFTVAGLMVFWGAVAAGVMGLDTENTVAYQAFTLLAFLVLLAFVSSWAFRIKFSARRTLPRFGTVGMPLRYSVLVKNLSSRPQAGLTLLEELSDPRPNYQEWRRAHRAVENNTRSFRVSTGARSGRFKAASLKAAEVPRAQPGQEVEARIEFTPLRRGVLRFKAVTLARSDPLGLYRALCRKEIPQTTLILPRRYLVPPLMLPGIIKYQEGGVAMASKVGQSEEFIGLRDYRPGDPLRHIHWRSWAKAGRPVVREFEDEFFVRHALVLDTFARDPHSEAFEEAVSVAASFACSIRTQESLLDLLFVGPQSYCFTAGRGLGRSEQMLEVLASVQPCAEQSFSALEHLVFGHAQAVSGCICVLLEWDDQRQEFVRKIKLLGVPVVVVVVTGPGQAENVSPGIMRAEPERFLVVETGNIEAGLAKLKA